MIRLATPADGPAVAEIYAPYVQQTAISFEAEPPCGADMSNRIAAVLPNYPWLVFEADDRVIAYAYGRQFRDRFAYQWTAEVGLYVDGKQRGKGVGRALYSRLLPILGAQGYCTLTAGVTLPNPASVALHESFGFRKVGVLRQMGYKLGNWHDVSWWDLILRTPREPSDLVALEAVREQFDL